MAPESSRHHFAQLSFAASSLLVAATSVRHVYRFGFLAMCFALAIGGLLAILHWYRRYQSAAALWVYALFNVWLIVGFGLVDGLWRAVILQFGNSWFPELPAFSRVPPAPFGFEAAGIMAGVAALFAAYYLNAFLRAPSREANETQVSAPHTQLMRGLTLAFIVIATGFGVASERGWLTSSEAVKIGVIVPLRGPAAPLGRTFVNAVTLALADRTTQHHYELSIVDGGVTPAETRAAIERLIYKERVQAIVGGISLSGQVVKPYASAEHIVHLCVCSVREIGDGQFNFTNIPLPEDESDRWVIEAERRGIKRVAILAQQYPSIDGHINALVRGIARSNLRLVYEDHFPASTKNFNKLIEAARGTTPDVYFVEGFDPALDLLGAQLKANGIANISSIVALAISERPNLFEGAWYTDSYVAPALKSRFQSKFPETRFIAHMVPYAYDSMNMVIDAFENGEDVVAHVRRVTEYRGAAGTLTRDRESGNFRSRPAVWEIVGGKPQITAETKGVSP